MFNRIPSVLLVVALLSFHALLLAQTPSQPPAARPTLPAAPPDVAAPPADAEKTPSGLRHKLIAAGTGTVKSGPIDQVTVNYTGWTSDGKAFDSSVVRGRSSTLFVNRVIPGWVEGLQLMAVGETRRFWVPESLAFKGQEGRPKGMLVFDIELLEIAPSPLATPVDVASPPSDAKRTDSGLAYKVLHAGSGTANPNRRSHVTVHYTGWTTDGKLFDSSVARGQPSTFALDEVIQGWTEGVQLMVVGDKTRFWIPQNLAYKGQPGMPRGMLVFDVELIEIQP